MTTRAFNLSAVENERAKDFVARHRKKHGPDQSASGGRFTYSFTPTSLGTSCELRCAVCGKTRDVTDYDSW